MTYARKKDSNHEAIAALAKVYGWQVVDLSGAGRGVPDILAYHPYHGFRLIEVKAGKGANFTPAQASFRRRYAMPITTISSVAEADVVFGPNAAR